MSEPPVSMRAPYKLFDYYTYADRDLFFGREREVLHTVGEILSTRLLVLFAPSGSGKSSLINAGVRPRLEERGFDTVTIRLDCVPELAVKRQLRTALSQFEPYLSDQADLHAGLRAAYAPGNGRQTPRPLVIFLDQFEEFFIVFPDAAVRRAFIRQVALIKFDSDLPVYLVLSLRDDYFVRLNEFRDEIPSIFHNNANIQLRPLDDAAALRAIVEPARKAGVEYEDGLPQEIIRDLRHLSLATAGAALTAREVPSGGVGVADGETEGVLPITIQIICYRLWERRRRDGSRIPRQLYAGSRREGGLGGAAAILRTQLSDSLRLIPRRDHQLMRRLFRVLMTVDLTKRLRSVADLAQILRVPPEGRLKPLLRKLHETGVLREEHREGEAWYEFRHDYLVKEVWAWVEGFEARMRQRRRLYGWGLGVLPMVLLATLALWNFTRIEVRFTPKRYDGQEEELFLTRRFNPFGFNVTTGFRKDEVSDYQRRNEIGQGYLLSHLRPEHWSPLTNTLDGEALGRLLVGGLGEPGGIRLLLGGDTVRYRSLLRAVPLDAAALTNLLRDELPGVRLGAAAMLGELSARDDSVLKVLMAMLQSGDSTIRGGVVTALAGLRPTDGTVLAVLRDGVEPATIEGLLALSQGDVEEGVSESAARALEMLGRAGAPVVPHVLPLLDSPDPVFRRGAVHQLGRFGRVDRPLVERLLHACWDPDLGVGTIAVQTLRDLGRADAALAEQLVVLLTEGECSEQLRQVAGGILVGFDRPDAGVWAGWLGMIRDKGLPWLLRLQAAQALTKYDQSDGAILEGIQDLVADENGPDAVAALKLLADWSAADERLMSGLLDVLANEEKNTRTRLQAGETLVGLGRSDAPVVDGLLALLKDERSFGQAMTLLAQVERQGGPVVESLVRLSGDEQTTVRRNVGAALGLIGESDPRATQVLLRLITDRAWNVRLRALEALRRRGRPEPDIVYGVLVLLDDLNPYVRQRAADALRAMGRGDAQVIGGLMARLNDQDPNVRQSVVAALGELGRNYQAPAVESIFGQGGLSVVLAVAELLQDNEAKVRLGAATGLASLSEVDLPELADYFARAGARIVDWLLSLLGDEDRSVGAEAARALALWGRADGRVSEQLLAILSDGDVARKLDAAQALLRMGRTDVPMVESLVETAVHGNAETSARARELLFQCAAPVAPLIDALTTLTRQGDALVRCRAARRLIEFGRVSRAVLEGVAGLLDGREDNEANEVLVLVALSYAGSTQDLLDVFFAEDSGVSLKGWARFASSYPPFLEGLRARLVHGDVEVRLRAAEALSQLGSADESVVAGLLMLLRDKDQGVRKRAAEALGGLQNIDNALLERLYGRTDALATEGFLMLLRDSEAVVRLRAVEVVTEAFGPGESALDSLLEMLYDRTKIVRAHTAAALTGLSRSDPALFERLVMLLRDEDGTVRAAAATTIAQLGQGRADWSDEWALERIEDDVSVWREAAGLVLSGRGNPDPGTVGRLRSLLVDARPWVRMAAWDALLRIEGAREQEPGLETTGAAAVTPTSAGP